MKLKSRALVVVFCLLIGWPAGGQELTVVAPDTVGLSPQRLERLRQVLRAHVEEGRIVGVVALIARHGKVAFFESFGLRDRETGTPMPVDAIFRIYSMTKPITSVAVMMLYEEGTFLLTDPVSKYIPGLGKLTVGVEGIDPQTGALTFSTVPAEREMTIQDLLRHTSGLTYGFFGNSAVDKLYVENGVLTEDETIAETVEKLGKLPLKHQPGTNWEYSVSTDVLGRLVEVASGMPLDRFFAERLFQPLGMKDTGFYVEQEKLDRLATLYTPGEEGGLKPDDQTRRPNVTSRPTYLSGGGGLVSTAADYLRFAQMLLNGGDLNGTRLLSRKTVELMTADHLGTMRGPRYLPGPGYGFGLGFAVRQEQGVAGQAGSVGEYWWAGAAGTGFWIDPLEELIGIFMIQIRPALGLPYREQFKNLVYQAIVD